MSAEQDVAVIGAGAAGVAAMRRLAASSLSSILLEATARVGGRAWTFDIAGMRLDLGCGWLHSADRNPWTRVAEAAGFAVDRSAPPWGRRYQDIGFSQAEQAAARQAYAAWHQRMESTPPAGDCAADALEPEGEWNAYLQAVSGFMNGAGLEHVSVADATAYDAASTGVNWRTPAGYGALIAVSLPHPIDLRLSTPVQSIELDGPGVQLTTAVGAIRARAAILTVSTAVLAGSTIRLPSALDPWRHAAACAPLGRDEKLFLEIVGENSFAPETRVIANPRDRLTGVYHIRPFGWPVIECFVGPEAPK
jgi:monoamine oxidase